MKEKDMRTIFGDLSGLLQGSKAYVAGDSAPLGLDHLGAFLPLSWSCDFTGSSGSTISSRNCVVVRDRVEVASQIDASLSWKWLHSSFLHRGMHSSAFLFMPVALGTAKSTDRPKMRHPGEQKIIIYDSHEHQASEVQQKEKAVELEGNVVN